jgi:8-oxo-dGTP diphosphatase
MTARDGNGWTRCGLGHRHWGRHGAAGLLLAAPASPGQPAVLLAQRTFFGSHGGHWGPPGGARDSHETPVHAALRETAEECGIDPGAVTVHGLLADDHGGWTYHTVLAAAQAPLRATPAADEIREVAWIPAAEVSGLRLHPGFAAQWPVLRAALAPLVVIVDAANVVGARADGWWRDRAGAAARLCAELATVAAAGIGELPQAAGLPRLERWFPQVVVVLEGAARAADYAPAPATATTATTTTTAGGGRGGDLSRQPGELRVVRAEGSGDDKIAALAATLPGYRLVVTADRELRARCQAAGASVTGPSWLLGLI